MVGKILPGRSGPRFNSLADNTQKSFCANDHAMACRVGTSLAQTMPDRDALRPEMSHRTMTLHDDNRMGAHLETAGIGAVRTSHSIAAFRTSESVTIRKGA